MRRACLLILVSGILVMAGVAAASTSQPRLFYRAHVDVTGSGHRSLVTVTHASSGGRLTVSLGSGHRLSVALPSDAPFLPGLVSAGNVDGRPGAELFVDVLHITTDEEIRILTVWNGHLRSGGQLPAYGEDNGIRFGMTCAATAKRHLVTDHAFTLHFAAHPRYWSRRDTVYAWTGPHLVRIRRGPAVRLSGAPPAGQLGVRCGSTHL